MRRLSGKRQSLKTFKFCALDAVHPGSHSRTRLETWTYDPQDRLTGHTTPERTTTWQLDAGGRRTQQTVVATAGATGPPGNDLEAGTSAPAGTLTYSYNNRDQLTQVSGSQSATYTYDANGNRLSQTETRSGTTQTTRYHWNAQDQLVKVEQGSGSTPPELLASYRYTADNLRAEKVLSDAGLYNATQASVPTASPLAYERTQWDGLHARRSYEVTGTGAGANNTTQTLRSDTDAAVMAGNTAPILFNRTTYANGLGSASSTTQLHADSQGTLIATVVSEGSSGSTTAKANSLLHYSPYGLIDSQASGNAGTGLQSNGNAFGSYYADPETGLLYARARYFDPASGQFVSRDPEEGEANLPITWGAYQYGRYNPYRYSDPNGRFSTPGSMCSTAEECAGVADTAIGVGRSLWKGAKETAGLARSLAEHYVDAFRGALGNTDAQKRVEANIQTTAGIIRNIPNLPAHLARQQQEVEAQVRQLQENGDVHEANRLLAEHTADIAQLGAGAYGLGKVTVGVTKAAIAGIRAERAIAPAVAAKTPSAQASPVQAQVGPTTPELLGEAADLGTTGRIIPPGKTAVAASSRAGSEIGANGGVVAVDAGSVKGINPTGSTQNCTNCVAVVDNLLTTGNPASALPRATPIPFDQLGRMYGTKLSGWTSQQTIESTLLAQGNGARAVIYGTDGATGHVWNAVVQNGKVNYIDGQIGGSGASNFKAFTNFQFGILP
ncbi:MAG: RHS repeat-associated core domain-containing protein [Acidovorax sp.]|nr:RHS repeat-associated core domain-containing protein [Acidovorax sp.]